MSSTNVCAELVIVARPSELPLLPCPMLNELVETCTQAILADTTTFPVG